MCVCVSCKVGQIVKSEADEKRESWNYREKEREIESEILKLDWKQKLFPLC